MINKFIQIAVMAFLFVGFISPASALPLARLSVLPLSDPKATVISGQDFIRDSISAGFEAMIFFENVSSTEFTNNTILVALVNGEHHSSSLGNIGPTHSHSFFGYPIAAFDIFSWDSIVPGARGRTNLPRPISVTFQSDQSTPITLTVTAPYDSVDVTPVPEPSTALLLGGGIIALSIFRKKIRSSTTV